MRSQTFLFYLLSLNQNVICNILCALNWICAWQNKKKQMYEMHYNFIYNIFNKINYVGNMLSARITPKEWEKCMWLLGWFQIFQREKRRK